MPFFWLALCISLLGLVAGQIPIPKHRAGFVYNLGEPGADVWLDAYMGPLCIDSKPAFPTLLSVADSYGPKKLQLTFHLFPLPYHHNAFLAAKV